MEDKNNELEYVFEDFKLARKKSKKEIENDEKEKELERILRRNRKDKKNISIILFVIATIAMICILIFNWDKLTLPKNSVMITVTDQNGDVIEGLIVRADSKDDYFAVFYEKNSNPTVVNSKLIPGEYKLDFRVVPNGYECPKIADTFVLNAGDRIKLNYECKKLN